MKRLTASVVGCGMGGQLSMTGLAASEEFTLVAAADISPAAREKVAEKYPGLRTFATPQEMFAECPTDIVCVSTWAPSHRELTLAALTLPQLKGILVEKPLGETAAAWREILDAVKRRGIPMAVPHGLLVAPHASQILRHVHQGDIGDLRSVEIENAGWDIINAGIHWLNFAVALTQGEPIAWVLAACDTSTRTYRDGMQVETLAVTYAQTVSGRRFIMNTGDQLTASRPGKKTLFRLAGTAGMIEFWGWESAYMIWNEQSPAGRRVEVPAASKTRHQMHLENLAAQIHAGTTDYAVAESSLSALELCEAAYVSARHHCTVTFPLETFTPPPPNDWQPGLPYSGTGGGRDGRQFG